MHLFTGIILGLVEKLRTPSAPYGGTSPKGGIFSFSAGPILF